MISQLSLYVSREEIAARLPIIFPEGISNRTYCIREMAVSTIFVMLYIGAVEGNGRYLGPYHVYRMTGEQALLSDTSDREMYAKHVLSDKLKIPGTRWYKDNTREPIRDETLRDGLVSVGAVLVREDLPTTSSKPRYSLKAEFAALFDPALTGEFLEKAIATFQAKHLSPSALARVSIIKSGAAGHASGVMVTFPNGETRQLAPGPSSIISRAVVEEFTKLFMEAPVLLWLSESGNKVVARDDKLAGKICLKIEADKNLPDLILADLGPADPLIVFVEVVATDGAVTVRRRDAIYALTDAAGFTRKQIVFLTAYQDRSSVGFKKTVSDLAWGSLAWFVSEPNEIMILRDGQTHKTTLSKLISG